VKPLKWGAFPEQQLNILSGRLKMAFSGITNVVVAHVHLRFDSEILGADVTVWNTPEDVLLRVGNLDVRVNVHSNYCQVQLYNPPGFPVENLHLRVSAFGLGTP